MANATGLTMEEPAYYERLSEIEGRHWWSVGLWRLAERWLDRALAGREGLRALDVGCGAGATADRLARRDEIALVIGIDPGAEALRQAARWGFPRAGASVLALPFQAGTFDLVTCLDVLQHVGEAHDRAALREVARVLRPGGLALIRSNGRGWLREGECPGGVTVYRLGELVERVKSSGLEVERATYANCLPSLAQELAGRLGWPFRARPSMLPHPSLGGLRIRMPSRTRQRVLGTIVGAEAVLAGRCGLRLPFGHSTLILARKPGAWR